MKNTTYQKIAVILLALIGLLLAPAVFAEEDKTVLERIKIVEDPELAKLISIAIDKYPHISTSGQVSEVEASRIQHENKIGLAKAIRTVTETYAQIKLLDEKIRLINTKIDGAKTTKDIESELILAKSTLETERLTKIAQMRETLNWTPWSPFNAKEVKDLNTWIHLEVLDDVIRLCEIKKPFNNSPNSNVCTHISFCSYDDIIKYLENIYKQKDVKPVRITLFATKEGSVLAEKLEEQIRTIAKNAKADFQTDLAYGIRTLTTEHSSLSVDSEKRFRYENGVIFNTAKDLAGDIKERLQRPGAIPRIYHISYVQISYKDKAKELEDALNAVIKELGYTKYVQVENKGPSVEK